MNTGDPRMEKKGKARNNVASWELSVSYAENPNSCSNPYRFLSSVRIEINYPVVLEPLAVLMFVRCLISCQSAIRSASSVEMSLALAEYA